MLRINVFILIGAIMLGCKQAAESGSSQQGVKRVLQVLGNAIKYGSDVYDQETLLLADKLLKLSETEYVKQ